MCRHPVLRVLQEEVGSLCRSPASSTLTRPLVWHFSHGRSCWWRASAREARAPPWRARSPDQTGRQRTLAPAPPGQTQPATAHRAHWRAGGARQAVARELRYRKRPRALAFLYLSCTCCPWVMFLIGCLSAWLRRVQPAAAGAGPGSRSTAQLLAVLGYGAPHPASSRGPSVSIGLPRALPWSSSPGKGVSRESVGRSRPQRCA